MNSLSDYPDQISLKGMAFYGYTGVFDFEKQNGQTFLVDLTLCFSGIQAVDTDILADTVHYGEVFDTVKKIVESSISLAITVSIMRHYDFLLINIQSHCYPKLII